MQQVSTDVLPPSASADYTLEELQMAHGATVTRREALQAVTEKLQTLQVAPLSPPPPAPSDLSHADIPRLLSQPLPAVRRLEPAASRSRAENAAFEKVDGSTAGLRRVLAPGGPEMVTRRVWESLEAQRKGADPGPTLQAGGTGVARANKLRSRK